MLGLRGGDGEWRGDNDSNGGCMLVRRECRDEGGGSGDTTMCGWSDEIQCKYDDDLNAKTPQGRGVAALPIDS